MTMAKRIMDAMGANVDRWYADAISYEQFGRNQSRLWALVYRLNLDDQVMAVWRQRNPIQ